MLFPPILLIHRQQRLQSLKQCIFTESNILLLPDVALCCQWPVLAWEKGGSGTRRHTEQMSESTWSMLQLRPFTLQACEEPVQSFPEVLFRHVSPRATASNTGQRQYVALCCWPLLTNLRPVAGYSPKIVALKRPFQENVATLQLYKVKAKQTAII
jgi:hypothetical protein